MPESAVWFELADYLNADSLLRDIMRAIALRTGRYQSQQVTLHPLRGNLRHGAGQQKELVKKQEEELTQFLEDMCKVWRLSPSRWKIFVYGRELAGSCVGWMGSLWKLEDWKCLESLLKAFASAGFNVVYAIPTTKRWERKSDKWAAVALGEPVVDKQVQNVDAAESRRFDQFMNWRAVQHNTEIKSVKLPKYYGFEGEAPMAMSLFDSMTGFLGKRYSERDGEEFRRFFYAVTLFRQSRAPSALFYEAVQRCPKRFNMAGIDNDVLRARTAAKWVQELRDQRIFYHKPGGFSWMHRDLRQFARADLERHFRVNKLPQYFAQTLSYTHFWIGDWYFKAFCSTGFTLPIIECLHHRFQAALMAQFARPRNIKTDDNNTALARYRFGLLRSALLELTKTLTLTRQQLKLWLANEHGFPMFSVDKSGNCIIHNLSDSNNSNSTIRMSLEDIVKLILAPLKSKTEKLGCECEMRFQIDLLEYNIRATDQAIREEASINREWLEIEPLYSEQRQRTAAKKRPPRGKLDFSLLTKCIYDDSWIGDDLSGSNLPSDMLQKILDNIVGKKSEQLMTLLDFASEKTGEFSEQKYAKEKGECLHLLAPHYGRLLPLLTFFEQLAYARLRRAKFVSHSLMIGKNSEPKWTAYCVVQVREAWLRVSQLCNLAIDWCKHLPAESLPLEMRLKVRLHSYYAVALANLDRFHEAHRHIDEAGGIDSKREMTLPRIELAKLRLRRAEVFLTEAHRIRSVILALEELEHGEEIDIWGRLGEYWCLEEMTVDGVEKALTPNLSAGQVVAPREKVRPWIHPSVRGLLCRGKVSAETAQRVILDLVRLMTATIDDAWVRLEYAEKGLAGQSQSNLWWGRLAVMKLRAFSYQFTKMKGLKDTDPQMRILAYQYRRINPQILWEIFESSYLNNGRCAYRRLRLIRYTAEALKVCVLLKDDLSGSNKRCLELDGMLKVVCEEIKMRTDSAMLLGMSKSAEEALKHLKVALYGTPLKTPRKPTRRR